jgi:hypothetical protein
MGVRTDLPQDIKKLRRMCVSITHISRILSGHLGGHKKAFRLATTDTLLPSAWERCGKPTLIVQSKFEARWFVLAYSFVIFSGVALCLGGRSCRPLRPVRAA